MKTYFDCLYAIIGIIYICIWPVNSLQLSLFVAKLVTTKKIEAIIRQQFAQELQHKENEVDTIDQVNQSYFIFAST